MTRRTGAQRGVILAGGGLLMLTLMQLGGGAPAAAAIQVEQGTVPLSSVSSTSPISLPQFDPADGTLEQVTITLTAAASASVEVTNLTPAAKSTTVIADANVTVIGPGVTGLTVAPTGSQTQSVAAATTFTFGVTANGTQQQVITAAADLAAFTGAGTVTFNVSGAVGADVQGPSTWRGSGSLSGTASVQVEYQFNVPPVAVADSATVLEDAGASAVDVLSNDTDTDGGAIAIAAVTQPTNGTVVITGGGSGLSYEPNPNYCNDPPGGTPDTFSYTLTPGGSSATVSITVTCVDRGPTAVNDTADVNEDDAETVIDVLANDTDIDGGPMSVQSVSQPANGVGAVAGGGTGVSYTPDPDFCGTDTFTYTVNGGSTATVTITVACVDDPPAAVDDSVTVDEDAAGAPVDVLANDIDDGLGAKVIVSATDPANGTVVLTGGSLGAHTGLTYQPDPNYCNTPPGTTPDTFTYTLNGGSSATVSLAVTCVNDAPVADDETFDGASSAVGNTTLVVNDPDDAAPATPDPTDSAPAASRPHKTISGEILAGDTDIDGPGPLTITAGTFATNDGGTVTIESDGDFVFEPAAGTSCTDASDFFDYVLNDGGSPSQMDTGRVTIAITGCVWYVNNGDADGNTGTAASPFDTLAQAETASSAGHSIFVYDGNDTTSGYDAGITLKANQQLISEAATLVVGSDTLHSADATNRPTITDNNADVVELDDANTIKGFTVDPQGTGGGIAGASGDTGGATIDDITIVDSGTFGQQPGLELDATTGTFNISNLVVNTSGAIGVRLNNAGTVNFAPTSTISITTTGARGLEAGAGTSFGTSTIDAITVTNSPSGGVVLTATTGALTLGDGSGTDLSLTTTSGSTAAFFSTHTGSLTVDAAGNDNVSATGGPAIDVTGPGTFDFDDVDSTNSSSDGINLENFGSGTFTALSGDIGGAAGIAFDLAGGDGTVTYPGNLNNGTGNSVEITGRTGGSVTLSGQINDTNDAGGGISLTGNSGGTTNITNATKTLNTGASPAVTFTTSNGHTLNLTGGGLDIDTTSGPGVNASDAGTITVTGASNTITTTTGTALNVTTTDIAATGATFQSISADGAASGIVLNTTGSSGGLTVTGTGAADSGGTIQNTSSHAIALTNTRDVNITRLRIMGANRAGVKGVGVTNFSYTNGTLSDVGDSRVDELDAAFAFNTLGTNNVSGVLTITGNTVTSPYGGGVQVRNASGTISNATISSNTFQSTTDPATSKQDGVSLIMEGTPTTAAALTQAAISGNTILNFPSGSGVELIGEQITSTSGPRVTFGIPDTTTRVVVSNNEIRGNATNKMGVFGVAVSMTGMADGNVRVANNGSAAIPMQNILGEGIGVGASGTSNADFIIENNFVSPGNVSGNVGIGAYADRRDVGGTLLATPDVNVTIQNNTVSNTTGSGIRVLHLNSNGNLRAKIVNNTVGAAAQPNPGISIENGSSNDPTFNPTLCAQISGNPATGSGPDGFGNTFAGIDLIERSGSSNSTYRLQIHGLTPSPATPAQTETFLAGQNPASSLGGGFYAGKRATVSAGNQFEACTITF